MTRTLFRYSVEVALWMTVALLAMAAVTNVVTYFGMGLPEHWGFVAPMHVLLIVIGGFTAAVYEFRGESYDTTALPQWAKRPALVLSAYFLWNMILLAGFEKDPAFQLRCLSSGWMAASCVLAGYLWYLRGGLRPGFREVRFRR